MNEYRYILEKGSKKHHCPACGKRRFVRYVDTSTGDYLPPKYGRCDRAIKCSYHLNPYQDGLAKAVWKVEQQVNQQAKPARVKPADPTTQPVASIPFEILKATRKGWEQNTFLQNLLHHTPYPVEAKDMERAIALYQLGTVCQGYRAGAVTFPFIDVEGKIRAIQVKQFDDTNHTVGTDFLHSIMEKAYRKKGKPLPGWLGAYLRNEQKVSCLFGEHLLRQYPNNPVALVEAPKTAIVGTLYFGFPDIPGNLLWLATYNVSSLTHPKCQVLSGRRVLLFPDLKAYPLWSKKAEELTRKLPGTVFTTSDLLERKARPEHKAKGLDLADYLLQMDWRDFRKPEKGKDKADAATSTEPYTLVCLKPKEEVNRWDITDLENFFAEVELPTQPVRLDGCTTVTDPAKFVRSHLAAVRANNGKQTFYPFYARLQTLQTILETPESKPI